MSAKTQQKRLFAAHERAKLLAQTPRTPSGVIFHWSGVDFDLMPISIGTLIDTAGTIDKAADIFARVQGFSKETPDSVSLDLVLESVKLVATDAPEFIVLVRDHLAKSPGVCDTGSDEERAADLELYHEWFREQNAIWLLRTLIPMFKEVIGKSPLGLPATLEETPIPAEMEQSVSI